jgi:hypothetical protein
MIRSLQEADGLRKEHHAMRENAEYRNSSHGILHLLHLKRCLGQKLLGGKFLEERRQAIQRI